MSDIDCSVVFDDLPKHEGILIEFCVSHGVVSSGWVLWVPEMRSVYTADLLFPETYRHPSGLMARVFPPECVLIDAARPFRTVAEGGEAVF